MILLAFGFFAGMGLMSGRSNDPATMMQTVGTVSGVGALGLVIRSASSAGEPRDAPSVIGHLLIVATGFRLAGILLGVASIAALVDVADTWFLMRRMPPPEAGPPLDIKTYGLFGLLSNAARGVGYGLHALGGLVSIILVMVAIAAALGLLVALLLYLTGSGIGHHAIWARIVAILIASSLTVASCAIMVAMRCDHAAFAALPIGLSAYTLWVLIWRFA